MRKCLWVSSIRLPTSYCRLVYRLEYNCRRKTSTSPLSSPYREMPPGTSPSPRYTDDVCILRHSDIMYSSPVLFLPSPFPSPSTKTMSSTVSIGKYPESDRVPVFHADQPTPLRAYCPSAGARILMIHRARFCLWAMYDMMLVVAEKSPPKSIELPDTEGPSFLLSGRTGISAHADRDKGARLCLCLCRCRDFTHWMLICWAVSDLLFFFFSNEGFLLEPDRSCPVA